MRIPDRDLALTLQQVQTLEGVLRDAVKTEDLAEKDAAVNVLRLVPPLRRQIETWLALRALRKTLQATVVGVK